MLFYRKCTAIYYWSPIGLTAKPMSWLKLSCFCIRIASFILLLRKSSSWLRMMLFSQSILWLLSIACAATAESSVLSLFRCRLCSDCRVQSVLPVSPIYTLSQSRHGMLQIMPFLDPGGRCGFTFVRIDRMEVPVLKATLIFSFARIHLIGSLTPLT